MHKSLLNYHILFVFQKKPADVNEISCLSASKQLARLAKSKYLEQQLKGK